MFFSSPTYVLPKMQKCETVVSVGYDTNITSSYFWKSCIALTFQSIVSTPKFSLLQLITAIAKHCTASFSLSLRTYHLSLILEPFWRRIEFSGSGWISSRKTLSNIIGCQSFIETFNKSAICQRFIKNEKNLISRLKRIQMSSSLKPYSLDTWKNIAREPITTSIFN